jgi:SAM-dependent methyltransferase
LRAALRESLLSTRVGYSAYMRARWGGGPRERPRVDWINRALKTQSEVDASVAEAKRLRLPPLADAPKTWDTLAALNEVVTRTGPDARVLDAGAEVYSRFLPWLYLYGYRQLFGINLIFDKTTQQGPIRYEQGDITKTRFEAGWFDAIACLSVVEHGVDLEAYFREMHRILKPGGVLVTSTDYFETPTDTRGLVAYGTPIRVFTKGDIEAAVQTAERCGFALTGPIDPRTDQRLVTWAQYDLKYSFVVFAMTKKP